MEIASLLTRIIRLLYLLLLKEKLEIFFPYETRACSQTATWVNIPTSFITGIFPISPGVRSKLTSLAGPKIHVSIHNDFSRGEGPVTIKVDSENLTAYFPLVLTEQAILLEDDLTASLHINEEINKAFLREFNPLIAEGGAYSKHPVSLRVNKQNFYSSYQAVLL